MNKLTTFDSAKLKLAGWYFLIILIISMLFSFAMYNFANKVFSRFGDLQTLRQKGSEEDFAQTLDAIKDYDREQFIIHLVSINLIISGIAGSAGYFLAGRTLKPIKNMMAEQNRFITDASHELKTPLTSLRTEFEVAMLEEDMSKQESKILIKSSFEEIVRLQGLAEKLIELTQLNKRNTVLANKEVGLLDVIEGALKKIVPIAKQKRITINNQVDDYVLKGEFQSLCELFIILLDNAIKYSPQKTEITLTSQNTDHQVEIHVIDQGVGISQKDLPHVFNRFYRADKSRSTSGYGLGLSIAREIVNLHRGSIHVESLKDRGTDFTVRLPIISTT